MSIVHFEEGTTSEYSKLYVNSDKELHLEDSDGYDVNLMPDADGYITQVKSIFIDCTSGIFEYDTSPAPDFKKLNHYWACAAFDGTYSSGSYQVLYGKSFQMPLDYHSGGTFRLYGFLDDTDGDVYMSEIVVVGASLGDNCQAVWGDGVTGVVVSMDKEIVTTMCEINITTEQIYPGTFVTFRAARNAGNANDTASSGHLGLIGAEFFYNAKVPIRTL